MRKHILNLLCAGLLFLSLSSGGTVKAQSVCSAPPYLGVGGPEVCVVIQETGTGAAPVPFRGPSPLDIPPAPGASVTVGDYAVDMTITYTSDTLEMEAEMDGTVTRTGLAGGTGNGLTITVHGGWGTPIPDPNLDLELIGATTATSLTILGGGALFPAVPGGVPAQDVSVRGGQQTLNWPTYGPGIIAGALYDQPLGMSSAAVNAAVGVASIAYFHLNEIGGSIGIPSGVGLKTNGSTAATAVDGPHFQCYSVKKHAPRPENVWVALEDQFDATESELGEIKRICTPVSKNNEEVPDPELHLVCYEIIDERDVKQPVLVTNQFGLAKEMIKEPRELCVPSTKKHLEEKEEQK